jgi:transglutaminase-like putative cysteine protease
VRYRINHVTRYLYATPVSLCHSIAHLKPRPRSGQQTLSAQIRVDPWPAVAREHADFFGNRTSYFSIQQSHTKLEITAVSEVEVLATPLPKLTASPPWELVRDEIHERPDPDLIANRIFALPSTYVPLNPAAAVYAQQSFESKRPVLEAAADLTARIFQDFEYDPQFSTVATPLSDVLDHRRGVCQDFAHLAIACLRNLGLAARYVSGYLETVPPAGQPKLRGADASHAWFSILVPGLGWVDFDPTNNQLPRYQHITAAIGRDFGDVTPLRGVFYGGGEHALAVAVDVDRLDPAESADEP